MRISVRPRWLVVWAFLKCRSLAACAPPRPSYTGSSPKRGSRAVRKETMTSPVIETNQLTKDHFSNILRKRFRAVDGLTLKVEKNETYGLLGLNGAGKTTTLKLLLGLLR